MHCPIQIGSLAFVIRFGKRNTRSHYCLMRWKIGHTNITSIVWWLQQQDWARMARDVQICIYFILQGMHDKEAAHDHCLGFVDGTHRPITRPTMFHWRPIISEMVRVPLTMCTDKKPTQCRSIWLPLSMGQILLLTSSSLMRTCVLLDFLCSPVLKCFL